MNTEQSIDKSIMENVASAKKAFMLFAAFCASGLILIMISALLSNIIYGSNVIGVLFFVAGYLVIATPCLCAFILKFGAFVDVGPIFITREKSIGNFIYRTVERDYMSQAGANLVITGLKFFLMFLVSLVLTPILTVSLYLIYNKSHKDAVIYAEENGISKTSIPTVNKTLVLSVVSILVALLIGTIIASAVSGAIRDKEKEEQNEVNIQALATAIENIPEEYYAEAYKGQSASGGFIAEFKLDGKTVYYGCTSNNFNLVDGLYSGSFYYIIEDVLYLDLSGGGFEIDYFQVCDNAEIKAYLLGRHISQNIGDGATLSDGYPYENTTRLEIEYNGEEYCIYIDDNNNIVKTQLMYDYADYNNLPETMFVIDFDKDLSEYKEQARQLINN